jgi:hypothetical protein
MNQNRFNAIIILDAIPDGEFNTARRLKDELDDIASYSIQGLRVFYSRIETMAELEICMSDAMHELHNSDLQPLLHLEGHGLTDESGFVLAHGEHCSWSRLKEYITPLNIAMQLNLLLILATCHGGSFASSISTVDPAPVWGLIGPIQQLTAGQIEGSFRAFYQTFFQTLSGEKAVQALNLKVPNVYYITTAERFFLDVWNGYKKNYCTDAMLEKRAKKMQQAAMSKKWQRIPSFDQMKASLSSSESKAFEKYRSIYFMYDQYPFNRTRFPITYEDAEAYVAEMKK